MTCLSRSFWILLSNANCFSDPMAYCVTKPCGHDGVSFTADSPLLFFGERQRVASPKPLNHGFGRAKFKPLLPKKLEPPSR